MLNFEVESIFYISDWRKIFWCVWNIHVGIHIGLFQNPNILKKRKIFPPCILWGPANWERYHWIQNWTVWRGTFHWDYTFLERDDDEDIINVSFYKILGIQNWKLGIEPQTPFLGLPSKGCAHSIPMAIPNIWCRNLLCLNFIMLFLRTNSEHFMLKSSVSIR